MVCLLVSPYFLSPMHQFSQTHHTPNCEWMLKCFSKGSWFRGDISLSGLSKESEPWKTLPPDLTHLWPSLFHAVFPLNPFLWSSKPFLENFHHSPHRDAPISPSTFLNISPIINSRSSCLFSYSLFRGETVDHSPASYHDQRISKSIVVSPPEIVRQLSSQVHLGCWLTMSQLKFISPQ